MFGIISYLVFIGIILFGWAIVYRLFLRELLPYFRTKEFAYSKPSDWTKDKETDFLDSLKRTGTGNEFIKNLLSLIKKFFGKKDYISIDDFFTHLSKLRKRGCLYEKTLFIAMFLFLAHFVYLSFDLKLENRSETTVSVEFEDYKKKNEDAKIIKDSSFVVEDSSYTYVYSLENINSEVSEESSFRKLFKLIYDSKEVITVNKENNEHKINIKTSSTLNLLSIIFALTLIIVFFSALFLIVNVARRYRRKENYIVAALEENLDSFVVDSFKQLEDLRDKKPITLIGNAIVKKINPEWGNNVLGFVYFGAAFLVIVVGLRGIGVKIHEIAAIEFINSITGEFLVDASGISLGVIFIALIFEFTMLCLLALTKFFDPETEDQVEPGSEAEGNNCKFNSVAIKSLINGLNGIEIEKIKELNAFISHFDNGFGEEGSQLRKEINEIKQSIDDASASIDLLKKNIKGNITEVPPDKKTILNPVVEDCKKITDAIESLSKVFGKG